MDFPDFQLLYIFNIDAPTDGLGKVLHQKQGS